MMQRNFSLKTYNPKAKSILVYISILLIMLSLVTFMAGCSKKVDIKTLLKNKLSGDDAMNAAVDVVDNFFKYLEAGKLEEAFNLISTQDKSDHNIDDFRKELKNVTKIVEIKINWVEVKNNIANVGIDLIDSYDNEEKVYKDLVISLVKDEDGSWKINFWD